MDEDEANEEEEQHSSRQLRTISSTIIKSYALANLINGISLAAIQIRNDSG